MPLLIDTDIGTDPDDLQVLIMAGRLGLDLVGITTVYGDTDLRARMIAAVAPLIGVTCPVVAGRRDTLSGRDVMWAGHEGEGVPGLDTATYDTDRSAPRFIGESAAAHAGSLDVLAIGPLTNLAVALLADPATAGRIRHLYVMGGDFATVPDRPEHNFASDAVATWIVLRSGVPMTIAGFDMTKRVVLRDDEQDRIEAAGAAGRILAANTRAFLAFIDQFDVPGFGRGHIPHDPIALLLRTHPHLFTVEPSSLEVTGWGPASGQVVATPDDTGTIGIVRDFDTDTVHDIIVELLARPDS